MSQRISEATRYTVYYKRDGNPEAHYECTARDRGDAMAQLAKHLNTKEFIVTRVIPGWPERKKGK